MENTIKVVAPFTVETEVAAAAQEKASFLAFPDERQGDLQYIRAILVSAGTNKNGAHFLPSEMMKAHNSIIHKAIDLEHEEDKVVGHIYDCAYLYKDGTQFNPAKAMAAFASSGKNPDEINIDIAIAGIIHKARFSDIAEELKAGDWKVSMECFFKDFDLKLGNNIITRAEAEALGYNPADLIGGFVKVTAGKKALGKHLVARVLREIAFSGMGLVKNPANPGSIVLETAAHKELLNKENFVIDLESIDNMRGHCIEIRSEQADEIDKELELKDNLIEVKPIVDGESADTKVYIELDRETGGIKRVVTSYGKEDAALRFSGPGLPGPGRVASFPDGICKSFRKRQTKFNAIDQSAGVVLAEHYCTLFEETCPVIGASSKAPECLRNQYNRTTRDDRDNTLTKTIREHINDAPSNTYTTILSQPALSKDAANQKTVVSLKERKDQIGRIKAQAEELRNSLKDFVAAEKKTLK